MNEPFNFNDTRESNSTPAEPVPAPEAHAPAVPEKPLGEELPASENQPTKPALACAQDEPLAETPEYASPSEPEPPSDPSDEESDDGPPETAPPPLVQAKQDRVVKRGFAIIAWLQALLRVVPALVAIHYRSKQPVLRGWNRITADYNERPEHAWTLGYGDRGVGVLLGAKSQRLIVLDFDDMGALRSFLRLNRGLRKTLTTQGARGAALWLIMAGAYPPSFNIKRKDGQKGFLMEFRADNKIQIILGRHTSGKRYRIRMEGPPMKVDFAEIKWPSEWPIPDAINEPDSESSPMLDTYDSLAAALASTPSDADRFGEPFAVGEKGKVAINWYAFADLFSNAWPIYYVSNLDFFIYENSTGLWVRVNREHVHRLAAHFFEYLARRYKLPKFRAHRSVHALGDLETILKGLLASESPQRPRNLLHLKNGMLDIDKEELLLSPFAPNYHSTSASPVPFYPEAQCPRWLEFLNYALPPDDVELLRRWAGLALSGYNSAQAILLLTGIGGAGKGVFVEVISYIVGRQNCRELRTRHLDEKFENSFYVGKTLLIGADVPGDFLNVAGAKRLKALSGHDELLAEVKYEPRPFSFFGTFNIVITSNQNLRVALDGDEEAWRRRLKIVHFTKKAPRVNPNFAAELIEEGSGILNWMIEGLIALRADMARALPWQLSPEQQERIDDLLAESDSLRAFVRNHIHKSAPTDNVTVEELHMQYESMCDDYDWGTQTKYQFQKMLPVLMQEIHGVSRRNDVPRGAGARRGFWGVRVQREVTE